MFKKIRKSISLLRIKAKYPDVIYCGAPEFLTNFFRLKKLPLKKGFYSQMGQDELIFTEFFKYIHKDTFPKLFIDIGCNHPVTHSNSYFLEYNQGYKVLAIDALQEMNKLWQLHRPNAEFVECAVGSENGELSFDVIEGGDIESMFSSVSGISKKGALHSCTTRTVPVRKISDILAERDIQHAGVLSMDIEGYELQALHGIDFGCFTAYIFIIENNSHDGLGDNKIRDLMVSNGYIYFARIWNLDDIFIHPDLTR